MESKKYHRIVLKLSGEALAGKQGYGIDPETVETIAKQVVEVNKLGVQVAIVVGGGNIWRGLSGSAKGMDRVRLHGHAGYGHEFPGPPGRHGKERRRYPRPDGYQHAAGR